MIIKLSPSSSQTRLIVRPLPLSRNAPGKTRPALCIGSSLCAIEHVRAVFYSHTGQQRPDKAVVDFEGRAGMPIPGSRSQHCKRLVAGGLLFQINSVYGMRATLH